MTNNDFGSATQRIPEKFRWLVGENVPAAVFQRASLAERVRQ
jgi:hypothetical protein